ncbi:hypothetical protein B0T25DRAFT_99010 [Lasiosphaeria hispida]|uniref:Serum paraoxonase/arylesterase family protein n=1 Tax=Lasiosphaeria hispida TaxID=260671 RepID=A0AAJ0HQP4_9PEZI|nr:hypothetical protein B0T25DRAFT_99010 [Lasiosphaeria hispida]
MGNSRRLIASLVAALLAYALHAFGPSTHQRLLVLGALRWKLNSTPDVEVFVIRDTTHCEDLHYHVPSETLFTACEDDHTTRFGWFPPLANFDDAELGKRGRGSIHVINPKTLLSQRLVFDNFDSTFVTHGIDVISDPKRPDGEAVYIFAVNHVPDPDSAKARSQIEVFYHVIGSSSVKHLRSVWHPLIRTPNDIFARSPTSFYVTNDHHYSRHGLMRTLEDLYHGANWTETLHIRLDSLATNHGAYSTEGVDASVALPDMHNSNGLGHGRSATEILVTSCASGVLYIGKISQEPANTTITTNDLVAFDSIIDNPSYFSDPFASRWGTDHSGFLLPGLARATDLGRTHRDPKATEPVIVWLARPAKEKSKPGKSGAPISWEKRVLFEDDGNRIRSASASVLIAIDPKTSLETGSSTGARKAWLFVTGFLSKNIIAVKIDL